MGKEWGADQPQYVKKAKDLGFDILEISLGGIKNLDKAGLDRFKEAAREYDMILTAGYGPSASENLASADEAVVKNAIAFYTDMLKKLASLDRDAAESVNFLRHVFNDPR